MLLDVQQNVENFMAEVWYKYFENIPLFYFKDDRFKTRFSHSRSDYQYGKTLKLEVVAEGIESQEILNELSILGCTTCQA